MTKALSIAAALFMTTSLSAQAVFYSPGLMGYDYPMGMSPYSSPYSQAYSPAYSSGYSPWGIDEHALVSLVYRAPSTDTVLPYAPSIPYSNLVYGYGYTPFVGVGITVEASGRNAYITAVAGSTVIPNQFGLQGNPNPVWTTPSMAYGPAAQPIATGPVSTTPRTARITAYVPADAELIIQGKTMSETGPVRTFETQPLSGTESFNVVVRQKVDDKTVDQTMVVNVKPGDHSSVMVLK